MGLVRREPHIEQTATPQLYATARDLIDSCTLVLAGWESDAVTTYLERPGHGVAAALDDIVEGTYSDYWPAVTKDTAAFWFGSEERYNPANRFQFTLTADDGDTRYTVYGDFGFADPAYKDDLGILADTDRSSTSATALSRTRR
jgi:hypothetical protein